MSIRPTERKDSAYSAVESPPTDLELKTKEAKSRFYFMLIFIGIDYIMSVLIIINESYFFKDKENDIILFIIKISCLTVFLLLIIILTFLLKQRLTKIIRYVYIIVLGLYYLFEIVWNIKSFIDDFEGTDWVDLVFFFVILLTIIPRLFVFYNIDLLIIKINEIYDCKNGEEHDKFRQNLENKMEEDRDNTHWSKTSLPAERKQQSQFLAGNGNTKKLNNDGNVYTIKENYIEEDKENEEENKKDNE